ncbi:MAG: hypothetical protein V7721_10890 [Porticoccaceae bacterium]
MTKVFAVIGNILALFSYGVALLAPLTPSEGVPDIRMLLLFVGFPLLLLLHAWRTYNSRPAKIVVIFEATAIVGFTSWLLVIQSGVLAHGS